MKKLPRSLEALVILILGILAIAAIMGIIALLVYVVSPMVYVALCTILILVGAYAGIYNDLSLRDK